MPGAAGIEPPKFAPTGTFVKPFLALYGFVLLVTLVVFVNFAHAETRESATIIEVDTAIGSLHLKLHVASAPALVADFISLVNSGYFNDGFILETQPGLGFVIAKTGGSMEVFDFKDEAGLSTSQRGSIAVNTRQVSNAYLNRLFVGYAAQPEFEKFYTIFGEVVKGLELVEQSASRKAHKVNGFRVIQPVEKNAKDHLESDDKQG